MPRALINWLSASWDAIRTSLWLLPALIFVVGVDLAPLSDRALSPHILRLN